MDDAGLKQKFEDLKDDLDKMQTTVKLKPMDVDPMGTWEDKALMVDGVCTALLATGLALEAIPAAGTVVGTGLIVASGVMKVTAMFVQQYVKHQAKLEQEQKKGVVETLNWHKW